VSKRKGKRQKRSLSQTIFYVISAILVASMVFSVVLIALPSPTPPTPTPPPTWTPFPEPTATPLPPEPSPTPSPLPTESPTEPPIGPMPPTETAAVPTVAITATETAIAPTATLTPTLTLTPTPSATPASAGERFLFAVAGDSRDNPKVYRRVLDAIEADGVEFLIHTGDLVNTGTEAQWQAFEEIMAGFAPAFYPVPGNHDGLDGALDGYLASSGAPAVHYSFDRGAVHFTLADSHHGGITAAELAWLRGDLSVTPQPVKMVVLHHPPFDPDGTDHIMAFGNEAFMALMAEMRVHTVFAGHIHAYARGERDGVQYVITGGAGAPIYTEDHPQSFHHYLRVTVQGEDVTIEIVQV
jgi:predicted phosphodiesterase